MLESMSFHARSECIRRERLLFEEQAALRCAKEAEEASTSTGRESNSEKVSSIKGLWRWIHVE